MFARAMSLPSSFSSLLSDVSVVCTEIVYGASALYNSDQFQQGLQQGWQGISQAINPAVATSFLRSSEVRKTTVDSFKANIVCYMAPALIYHGGVKPALHVYYGQGTWLETALDVAANLYLLRKALSRYHDNMVYNHASSKATLRDNPDYSDLKACDCEDTAKLQASLFSSVYYTANLLTIRAIATSIPVVGGYLAFPLKAQLYGQGLLEYKIGSVGMCRAHRDELLNKNNAYAFGLGLSLLGSLKAWELLIYYSTGVNSAFVTDALFYSLYQHHMMAALLIDKPLQGESKGLDIFYPSRLLTDAALKQVIEEVIPVILNNHPDRDILAILKQIMQSPPGQVIAHLILSEDFRSLDSYIKRPTVRLFLDINRPVLEGTYNKVLEIRRDKFKTLALYLPLLPKRVLSDKSRSILSAIKSEQAESVLKKFNDALNYLYPDRNIVLKTLFRRKEQINSYPDHSKADAAQQSSIRVPGSDGLYSRRNAYLNAIQDQAEASRQHFAKK